MKRKKSSTRQSQSSRREVAHPSRLRRRQSNRDKAHRSQRDDDEKIKCFAAINQVRRGKASSISAAARAEGTTVRAIRRLIPATISQDQPGGRIHVKPSDRYSHKVQILSNEGALTTTARGSRERDLAGQHRATFTRVLRGLEPKSALDQYRGKKVGGHDLVSDYAQLVLLAKAGVLGQLEALYVSPDIAA